MKYVGSKARLVKEIAPIIQDCISKNDVNTYYEPFVGGANMIAHIKCERRIGNDIDNLPIDLMKTAFDKGNKFFDELPNPYPTKEHYYDVRDNPEKYDAGYRAAVLLFASYNARVYGGCYGAFANTKDGGVRNYFQEAMRNFQKQLPLLETVVLHNKNYLDLYLSLKNAVIYCDPPYAEGIGYSEIFDTDMFWDWVRIQSRDNYVFVSEYEAPDDFKCIWSKDVKTHMNNRGKLPKVEKLFVYSDGKLCQ